MKWLFISLFIFSDLLLESIYSPIAPDKPKPDEPEESYQESYESEEPEFYSWELGTPDNLPETEIIYEPRSRPCDW
jgi:hypothetical protein